jgi:CheY-like chemotaxis protein
VAKTAHDGESALAMLEGFAPFAVLLDVGLPDISGYDLARRVRARPGMEHATLLALTGYGEDSDRARAAEAGFDHHLVKPVSIDSVLAVLSGEGRGIPQA